MTTSETPQTIEFRSVHGVYQAPPDDVAMQLVLIREYAWSVETCRSVLEEHCGVDFSDVYSYIAFAVIAAETGANLGLRA